MPIIKSAKKRVKVTAVKTVQNKNVKSSMKTSIKRFEEAVNSNDKEKASSLFKTATSSVDKAVTKGVIHKNNANHKKAALSKSLNKVTIAQ